MSFEECDVCNDGDLATNSPENNKAYYNVFPLNELHMTELTTYIGRIAYE